MAKRQAVNDRSAVFRPKNEISFVGKIRTGGVNAGTVKTLSRQISGGDMAEETAEQKLARLEAENKALKEQMDRRKPGELRLKISEKGGLSVYGLGRFPVTLYKEQWTKLLNHVDEIKAFLQEHDRDLKAKQ
jgi:hypothetical protein